jgi:hypothetical protein
MWGLVFTVFIVEIVIIFPAEVSLVNGTAGATVACALGQLEFCLADAGMIVGDVVVADLGFSLAWMAYESYISGKKQEFEWILIPALNDIIGDKK